MEERKMSTIDIPGNYDRVTATYIGNASNHFTSAPSYTKGSNEILIYSNYPEYLTDSHLGDASYPVYINRVTVTNKNKMLIFISHHLEQLSSNSNYYLAIRVYNPNTSGTIVFTKQHEGYSNTNNWNNPGYAWEDFFTAKSGTVSVPYGQSKWLVTKPITNKGNSSGSFLDYFGEFTMNTTSQFVIAVYVCKNVANIPGTTYEIPWSTSNVTYSGHSTAYSLTGSKTLDMADALVSYNNSFYYGISNPQEGWGSSTEKVSIITTQGPTVTTANNVGNYGLQYKLTFNFKNTSSTPVKIKAYLISNAESHFAGLSSQNGCSKHLHTNVSASSNRWNFYTSPNKISNTGSTIPITIDLTYCHLALGSRGAFLQFEAVK